MAEFKWEANLLSCGDMHTRVNFDLSLLQEE